MKDYGWASEPHSVLDGKPGEGDLERDLEKLRAWGFSCSKFSDDDQAARYGVIRDRAHFVAEFIAFKCPPSKQKALAFEKLEEACNWAFKAIATE